MKVFSRAYRERIESVISALGIVADGLVIGPDAGKDEVSALISVLAGNTLVVLPAELKAMTEGVSVTAVPYGGRLRRHEDAVWTDNYESSVHFIYHDDETAELAYSLCRIFRKDLSLLSDIRFRKDDEIEVHTEAEAIDVMKRLQGPGETWIVYTAPGYRDVRALAAVLSGYDRAVISPGADNARKLERALDRVVFSPLVRRLSAVFHSTDGAFCDKMVTDNARVVRVTLLGDKF